LPIIPPIERRRALLKVGQDNAGLHDGGAAFGIDLLHSGHVAREVHQDSGSHGIPGDRRASTSSGNRCPALAGCIDHCGDLAGIPWEDDDARNDPVIRCVGGILRTAPGPRVHIVEAPALEGSQHVRPDGNLSDGCHE
jgi:hypothetical protein